MKRGGERIREDGHEGRERRQRKPKDMRRRRQERKEEEQEESSGSCRLPFSDSGPDNAFRMGKAEQRKGLIHRRVRGS